MNPVVSIVVPVYKVEDYLAKCVNSLKMQSMKNIEIILVDDESPDNCPKICDEEAELDKRIKVIHQKKNGGLSHARNSGLKRASGKYVLFVDSDDYIETGACEELYSYVNNEEEIIVGDAIEHRQNEKSIIQHTSNKKKTISGGEFLCQQLETQTMSMAAWFCLYNRRFLLENNLFFKEGILHEDEQWTPRVFLNAKKVIYSEAVFYHYIVRKESITRKRDKTQNGIDLMKTCYELEEVYALIENQELKKFLNDYLVMLFLNAFYIGKLYRKESNLNVEKKFVVGKAFLGKNKLKAWLFRLSPRIYYSVNFVLKQLGKR